MSNWSNKSSFTTTIDCAAGIELTCGNAVTSGNLAVSGGSWDPIVSSCGFGTAGKEKMYRFTPTVSGMHQLNITGLNGGTGYLDYFYKASGSCSNSGWTCIVDASATGKTSFGPLTAGTEYYLLLDAYLASGTANHTFQIDCPADMAVSSTNTFQLSDGTSVAAGSTNQQIIRIEVTVTGAGNPLSATNFVLNTNGSTNATTDIANAKMYSTGTSSTFSSSVQFGSTVANPNGSFNISGTQALTGGFTSTTNYFWLVYDIKCTATTTNIVDAECNTITIGGSDYNTTAPMGSRPIAALYTPTYVSVGTSSSAQGSTLQQIVRINISGSSTCPQNAESVIFNTSTSTAPATDILAAKCYYTTSTTFSSATQFGSVVNNPAAGDITFTDTKILASGSGNYFWLVYDVDCAASTSNVLNGIGKSMVIASNTITVTGSVPTAKTIAAIASYDTKQDGEWNTGSTWACNAVPPNGTTSPINLNHNVSFDVSDFTYNGNLTVIAGKNLTFMNNTLTVGPTGGGNKVVTINGGLIMNGGVFNVNGSLSFGSSSSLNMSTGEINIDGNSGITGTSVSSSTTMLALGSSMGFTMTGGVLTIVDPNFTSSSSLISYSGTPIISPAGGKLRFGDGSSGTGTSGGFYYSPGSGGKLQWYNVEINGGTGTRIVYCNWELIARNLLEVKSGCELQMFDDLHVQKDVINNGFIKFASSSYVFCLGGYNAGSGSAITPTSNPQSITGSGVYNNTTSSPTANMPGLNVNNTSGIPIILPSQFYSGVGTGSVSSNLYLTSGILDIGGGTLILGISGTSAGTLTGGSSSAYIIGIMNRWIDKTTGSRLFPIGTGSSYYGATINYTGAPTTAGSLTAQFISGDAGSTGLPLVDGTGSKPYANTLCTSGYWQIDAGNSLAGGTYTASMLATSFSCVTDYATTRLLKRITGGGNPWTLAGTFAAGTGSNGAPTVIRASLTGFSQFAVSQGELNPLPVELTTFKGEARDKVNMLSWQTASEINSAKYLVERAPEADNALFLPIGEVNAKGNTTTSSDYAFMDEKPLAESYYRLKIMDNDGSFEYSKIIVLQNASSGTGHVNVYPVPAHNAITLAFQCNYSDDVKVVITDMNGRIVKEVSIAANKGQNTNEINIENLPMGMYHAHIYGADIESNVRIIRN